MNVSPDRQLLDDFPLSRTHTIEDACVQVGRTFSPHRLEFRGGARELDACHNQVRFRDLSLNTLRYGADVLIDPGQRGDFYMMQLPLAGHGLLLRGGEQVRIDSTTLTLLQPREQCRMLWSGDCRMILVQVPRDVAEMRCGTRPGAVALRFSSARLRSEPEVAAWWQAVLDLTHNLDGFGRQWLRHPAAFAAMEEFLLSLFAAMLGDAGASGDLPRDEQRSLRRAKEYIHAHLTAALTLPEIASHACVSPRTLEAAFQRNGDPPPLAYARGQRLAAVHQSLRLAATERRPTNVTKVAIEHGFVHMGRFAAQYRRQYGCSPSQTLRPH